VSDLWAEFEAAPEQIAADSEEALTRIVHLPEPMWPDMEVTPSHDGPTEREGIVRLRLVQGFFRAAVTASYDQQCGVCELSVLELLVASHIVPWSISHERRADPRNGICLCALHDRAFDRGLISFDADFRLLISPKARAQLRGSSPVQLAAFNALEGRSLCVPRRFPPDPEALTYHREHIFRT
jgi:putative restriction endonuclease